jgi:hypothetical protein
MTCLKDTQESNGCTLVITIHSPSAPTYRLFDGLILLHGGRLCFFGAGGDVPCLFFEKLGFPFERGYNSAEFLLETIARGADQEALPDFAALYAASPLAEEQRQAVARCKAQARSLTPGRAADGAMFANSFIRELFLLLRLRGLPRYSTPLFIFSRIMLLSLLGALFASFFYGLVRRAPSLTDPNCALICTHRSGRTSRVWAPFRPCSSSAPARRRTWALRLWRTWWPTARSTFANSPIRITAPSRTASTASSRRSLPPPSPRSSSPPFCTLLSSCTAARPTSSSSCCAPS